MPYAEERPIGWMLPKKPPPGTSKKIKDELRKPRCEFCGWDKTKCHLHRINPAGHYTKENTITLCPNCHAVETEKQKEGSCWEGGETRDPSKLL